MKSYKYILEGLDCANCAKKIEDKIAGINGYEDVNVNFSTLKLTFKTEKENAKKEITEIIKILEPEVKVLDSKGEAENHNNKDILRIVCGLIIYIIAILGKFNSIITNVLTIVSICTLLYKTAKKGFKQVIKSKTLDENTLIVISSIGSYLVGKSTEGIMVIILYEIGKILESKAVNKTRKSISNLMNIKPEYANLKKENEYIQIEPEKVKIGDTIIVKTGEKIPLDGIVIKGKAQIDNSALTGESKIISAKENDKVISGSVNVNGLIEIQVEKTYENSTVSQILNLVENATDKKAKTETFVSKAAKIYTPTVIGLAILVAVVLPFVTLNLNLEGFKESIYKALIFLVISCPCSIAISVPLSYFSGIGKASKKGILIKGSDYLDGIKDVKEVIFDKTGTITTGKFSVTKVKSYNENCENKEIIKLIASGEKYSTHPIANAILSKYEDDFYEIDNFQEISGNGIQYVYQNKKVKIGNAKFVNAEEQEEIGTIVYLKIDDEIIGSIILNDEIKSKTKEVIEKLHKKGINTRMFTGDKKEIALKVAEDIGIKNVEYEMLPQEKYKQLEKQIENCKTGKVAFIGDGINDSPVLARADIGISMGGVGSSSAIEASDIVIMTDELTKIIDAIDISKKTNKIIIQNLTFSIGVKIVTLLLSLLGIADMWEAVFADVGTTLITIFNTLRILK